MMGARQPADRLVRYMPGTLLRARVPQGNSSTWAVGPQMEGGKGAGSIRQVVGLLASLPVSTSAARLLAKFCIASKQATHENAREHLMH